MLTRPLVALLSVIATFSITSVADACTGVTLKSQDGAVVFGRTMEWGSFDLQSRVVIVPRGHQFSGQTPDSKPGLNWKAQHGFIGLDAPAMGEGLILDGMNEKGLTVNGFYLPGFTQYQQYDPAKSNVSIGPGDVIPYLLSTSETIDEAKLALTKVYVTPVISPSLGFAPPAHYIITEPSGKAVVIEYIKGELTIFEAPLGVITNAPNYDWHMTNLRNYLNLSHVSLPTKRIENMDFSPLGAGSGMIGLPGDNTPPSRFVRAVAFSQTARSTATGSETVYELFRILDNFNLPLGAAEGAGEGEKEAKETKDIMRSSTIWTTIYDTKNKTLYYHTQHNRRVRSIDVSKIDFVSLRKPILIPLDRVKAEDIEDVTPIQM
ncbi:choloylglycine hydrolase [Vibrio tarriae]|uniref:Choloylglycine hydrolase n=1 Tax=Vibrio tarriae TaxID=2014742 RepID=A0AAU8WA23_9VIBR|nr:choloylglycine hydrolase family protein [Vibrio tarriae]ASK53366.1 choloylglycine hydrolase [Vibrio tarriae]